MVSLKGGVLKIEYEKENATRIVYEICFSINIITIFAMYSVKMVATVTGLLTLAVAMLLWLGRKNKHIIIPYNTVWYLTLIIYIALSSIWAEYVAADFVSSLMRLVIILAMITSISIYVDCAEDLERLMTVFIFSLTVVVILELTSVPVSVWWQGAMGAHFSDFNPNELAFWSVCAETMAFYKFYIKRQRGYILLVALFIFMVVLSSSRKSMAASVVSPVFIIFLSFYKKNYLFKLLLVVAAAVGIFAFIMTNETAYQIIGRRFDSMIRYINTDNQRADNSLYLREYFVGVAKQMFYESPLFGKGWGNFAMILNNDYGAGKFYSHNNYWQLLSELGLVGLVMYYSFYVFCLIRLVRNAIINKSRICYVFLSLLVILIIVESGYVTFNTKPIQIVLGMAYAATYVGADDGRQYKYIENNINELEE